MILCFLPILHVQVEQKKDFSTYTLRMFSVQYMKINPVWSLGQDLIIEMQHYFYLFKIHVYTYWICTSLFSPYPI